MPLVDRQPDALSRLYAESLFELADKEGGRERLETLSGEIDELIELTRQLPDLSEFMASRIIAGADRASSLEKMFKGQLSELLYKFIMTLNRKDRLSHFLPIAGAFEQMVQEKFGRIEVDVYTKSPVPQGQLDQIAATIKAALDREPVVHTYTDEHMIGGVKIQIGDKLIDGSFQTRLRQMNELLKTEGSALMRERFDRAVEDND